MRREGAGSRGWARFLPGGQRPALPPPSGPLETGGSRPLLPRPGAQSAGAPYPARPLPSGDRKSAQQMRKWQARLALGTPLSPAPSQPSTTARLAPLVVGTSQSGLAHAQAPDPLGPSARPGPACPGCGRGCACGEWWEVPALRGWPPPAASLVPGPHLLEPGPSSTTSDSWPLSVSYSSLPLGALLHPRCSLCLSPFPLPSILKQGRTRPRISLLGTHPDSPETWGEGLPSPGPP